MSEILHLINEMSPYLLLGFFLAGLMHAFIPGRYYTQYLAQGKFRSILYATLFGIPLPLCSCGVIPTAMSLRREGASKGAVASFLIATPQTGVDSIIATYSLMGWPFAILRPIAALVTALLGGTIVNAVTPADEEQRGSVATAQRTEAPRGFWARMREALTYAYIEMMEDIGKWLFIGLIAAGLIAVFVPDSAFAIFKGNTLASMLLVLAIAIPMYLCATGSIPIAVALMLKGLTPGAALVLLMAGPACNIASILVIRKVMGTRTLLAYLFSIILGAVGFGVLIDYLQFEGIVNFTESLQMGHACTNHPDGWFAWLCTGILTLLLFNALVVRRYLHKTSACHCGGTAHDHCEGTHGHCGDTAHDHCEGTHGHCKGAHANEGVQGSPHEEDHACHCTGKGEAKSPCCGTQPETCITSTHNDTMTILIKGMNCNHCRKAAEEALLSVEGVSHASVDLTTQKAIVEGNASFEALQAAIESVGFTATRE